MTFLKHKHGHDLLVNNFTDFIDEEEKFIIAFVSIFSSFYLISNAILIVFVHENSIYSIFSITNASIKSEITHSNNVIQHLQTAEKVIASIVNVNFLKNANFPNVNFPNHSTEKSANASDKRKNTDQNAFYVVYFTFVVTSDIDFLSISFGVKNSVTISTNQLFFKRFEKNSFSMHLHFRIFHLKSELKNPQKIYHQKTFTIIRSKNVLFVNKSSTLLFVVNFIFQYITRFNRH